MGINLVSFVYNTLRERANNPSNAKYWLPSRIETLDNPNGSGPLLPFHADHWDLGKLRDDGGATITNAIANAWWSLVGKMASKSKINISDFQPIPNPDSPFPLLSMNGVTVLGLHNMWAMPNPDIQIVDGGYDISLTLQAGFYDGADHKDGLSHQPELPSLQLVGQYQLDQSVCAATNEDPNHCTTVPLTLPRLSWPTENITGTGAVTVNINNLHIDALVHISVKGANASRTLQATLKHLNVRGSQLDSYPDFELDPDKLTIVTILNETMQNIWKAQVINAFSNPATHQSFTQHINDLLNGTDNLSQISSMLTQQINKVFDDTLSAVPAGQLPVDATGQSGETLVDQYAFDRLRYSLNNPDSEYYLPTAIKRIQNPQLEPLTMDTVSLGDLSFQGMVFNQAELTNLVIHGLSNLTSPADQQHLDNAEVFIQLQLSSNQIMINGNFSLTPDGSTEALTGGLAITLTKAGAEATILFSGTILEQLQTQFTKLSLGANPGDMQINVRIDSAFSDVINAILNQDDVKTQAMQAINDKATLSLSDISARASSDIQKLIANNLDG